jgi:hypothetical protein
MNLKVVKNTYPRFHGVAQPEVGDEVFWSRIKSDSLALVRKHDNKVLFIHTVRSDGNKPNGKAPNVRGVISQVKSKGYCLEIS